MANTQAGLAGKVTLHPGAFLGAASGARRTVVIPTNGKVPGLEGATDSQCGHGAVCVDATEATADEEMTLLDVTEDTASAPAELHQSCGVRANAPGKEPEVKEGAQSFKCVVIDVRPGMQKTAKHSNTPAEEMLGHVLTLG